MTAKDLVPGMGVKPFGIMKFLAVGNRGYAGHSLESLL